MRSLLCFPLERASGDLAELEALFLVVTAKDMRGPAVGRKARGAKTKNSKENESAD
jgi:hypothetical protein